MIKKLTNYIIDWVLYYSRFEDNLSTNNDKIHLKMYFWSRGKYLFYRTKLPRMTQTMDYCLSKIHPKFELSCVFLIRFYLVPHYIMYGGILVIVQIFNCRFLAELHVLGSGESKNIKLARCSGKLVSMLGC